MGPDDFRRLVMVLPAIPYARRQLIYSAGAPRLGLFIVCRGIVKVAISTEDARSRTVKLVGPGNLLDEAGLFIKGPHVTSAESLGDAYLRCIPTADVECWIQRHPEMATRLGEQLAWEVERLQAYLAEMGWADSMGRVARVLLKLADTCGVANDGRGLLLDLELDRAGLAELAGVAPETAIRHLSTLKARGIIALERRRVWVLAPARLQELVPRTVPWYLGPAPRHGPRN